MPERRTATIAACVNKDFIGVMYLMDTKNAEGIGVPLSGIVSNVYAMRRDVLVIKVTNDFIALFCNKLRNRIRRRKSKSGEAHCNAMCKQFDSRSPFKS